MDGSDPHFVQFSFRGIEPLELADHLTVTRKVGKRCQSIQFRGDFAGLMERFAQTSGEGEAADGQSFRIIVIQEAGLDGFWIHRALQNEGIESHVVDAPRLQRRAGAGGQRPTRSMVKRWFERCSPTSAANLGSVQWSRRPLPARRPPPPLPRAQSANRRESATRQSYQRIIIQPGRIRISAAAPRPAPAAGRTPNRRRPRLPSAS